MSLSQPLRAAGTRFLIGLLKLVGKLPHGALKGLSRALSPAVFALAKSRRRIAMTNLALCFPHWSQAQRETVVRAHVHAFLRSFLERFNVWYADEASIKRFVRLEGLEHLAAVADRPVVVLAPHFVGLDMGGTRLQFERALFSMYAPQSNPVLDAEIHHGRGGHGAVLVSRREGMRRVVRMLKEGKQFYFLPDMDLGPKDAVFVPFFGVPAATVTSVARLAQLTGAVVVPAVTRMVEDGYVVQLYPAWENFPGDDLEAATLRMNAFIEARVLEMPEQYLWTHKRFKTRPPGVPSVYTR
jgi:Kdo2-lipid IVA lauroyltransferase/acyltransferase